jgi:hypothetical protein
VQTIFRQDERDRLREIKKDRERMKERKRKRESEKERERERERESKLYSDRMKGTGLEK